MAYHQEGNELVIDGFDKGISDNPFVGISDIRNANIVSTPGECAVNFTTAAISYPVITATVASANAGADTVTINTPSGTLENRMAITFSGGSLPGGIVAATVYYVNAISGGVTFSLYNDQALTSLLDITSTGTGSMSTFTMAAPTYSAYDSVNNYSFIVDSSGYVWGNNKITTGSSYWTFTGNTGGTGTANGNGLVIYQASNGSFGLGTTWMFVFRNGRIDYTATGTISWVYGWQPLSASTGSASDSLNTPNGTNNPHAALVGQDNTVYFTDANFIYSFFEKTSKAFAPTDLTTYTPAKQALTLPYLEVAQCLTELGTSLLVGGQRNLIYPWNRTATSFSFPIFLSELNVKRMITVNTDTYIFMGTRGRIYITNGTNANLYKKLPDHLSGTVDPIFTWGATGYHKNQLYFGVSVTNAAGTASTKYGGLWAIDLDTEALRMVNQLSYNSNSSFAGYATVFLPITGTNANQGTGFYVGWDSGSSTYGLDQSSANPYTNYDTYIESDMIPVGTYLKNQTFEIFEWKLSRPLVTGENVRLKMRNDLTTAFTTIGTSDSTDVGNMAGVFQTTPMERNQWLQLRAELNSTASSPSYVHLAQLRARSQTSQVIGTASPI